jgi:hypothetical protein
MVISTHIIIALINVDALLEAAQVAGVDASTLSMDSEIEPGIAEFLSRG